MRVLLAAVAAEAGRSELEEGTRVSAETSRRLSCDAAVVRVERDARGSEPDWRTLGPRWRRLEDAPDERYFRALEAVV